MKVVFIGASQFGLRCLENIIGLTAIEVTGIITNPPTFSISYNTSGVRNILHRDFHPLAEQHHIPIWNMNTKMNDPALVEQVKSWDPDFILVVGWYHMIPKVIRDIAPTGGLHASLLPDYSGGAPLVWAIINGEEKTGISFFLMDKDVDSGPIIGQEEETIFAEDTIATLYSRIEEAGLRLLQKHLPRIANGTAEYRIQDESKRRIVPQRSPENGEIHWSWPAKRIYDFIRAQTKPYPGAFSHLQGKELKIWKASLNPVLSHKIAPQDPGMVTLVDQSIFIHTGDQIPLQLHYFAYEEEDLDEALFIQKFLRTGSLRLESRLEGL